VILVLDNYDSFTFNLVHHLGELGADVCVHRNDAIDADTIARMSLDGLVVSPGPGVPDEAGVTLAAIAALAGVVPILGVCLGHQAIGQAFGGRVVRARAIVHGKATPVHHEGRGVFADLPSPLECGRYHSLALDRDSLPDCLEITSWTEEGEIMGVRHRTLDVEGIQFHPESILTASGKPLLARFLSRCSKGGVS
jgi:anthranilate synthase/aminodeoxychorismate synthase-like glutamine amidotransferase